MEGRKALVRDNRGYMWYSKLTSGDLEGPIYHRRIDSTPIIPPFAPEPQAGAGSPRTSGGTGTRVAGPQDNPAFSRRYTNSRDLGDVWWKAKGSDRKAECISLMKANPHHELEAWLHLTKRGIKRDPRSRTADDPAMRRWKARELAQTEELWLRSRGGEVSREDYAELLKKYGHVPFGASAPE